MIGSLLTRALALVLGYAYPAYECFKVVELNRPDIEQLRFWCKYWILVAALTVLERIGDNFISWLPMYSETKVAFFVYLWYPKTRGATYVYETFLQPYVSSHETEIDRNLLELKTRAGDFVFIYWQKAASYGQTRVYEILQYVASQAPSEQSRNRSTGQRQPAHQNHQTPASDQTSTVQEAAAPLTQQLQKNTAPASPTKRGSQGSTKTAAGPLAVPTPSQTQSSSGINITQPTGSETTSQPLVISGGVNQTSAAAASSTSIADNLQPQDTPMDEAVRMTRSRLRRRAASFDPFAHQQEKKSIL